MMEDKLSYKIYDMGWAVAFFAVERAFDMKPGPLKFVAILFSLPTIIITMPLSFPFLMAGFFTDVWEFAHEERK